MHHAGGAEFGELTLLGYDAYKLGFAHQPEEPLQPGDTLHVNVYWRAEAQPNADWQLIMGLQDQDGQERVKLVAEPVAGYPTSHWQEGDVWRGQFTLVVPSDAPAGWYSLRVQPLPPASAAPDAFLSEPLQIR
jgi:hypothetical protein